MVKVPNYLDYWDRNVGKVIKEYFGRLLVRSDL